MRFVKASMFALIIAAPAAAATAARADETHSVTSTPAAAPVGQPASLGVTIEGRNGWHINAEAPVSLKLMATDGVALAKPSLGRGDLVESTDARARFDVRATASAPGSVSIPAEASFVMCQETACKPVREKLTLKLAAADGKTAAGAPANKAPHGGEKAASAKAKTKRGAR